jgi:V/A-type H+-transporting ATPase subunit F
MKYFVIGDSDTVLGFAYASVQGRVAEAREAVLAALEEARSKPDVGVIIITDEKAAMIAKEISHIRLAQTRPLIVEIAGPKGPAPGRLSLLSMITEAVGMQV